MVFEASFFVTIAFFIFLALTGKYIFRIVKNFLDEYILKIKIELEENKITKEKINNLLSESYKLKKETLENAKNIIQQAEKEINNIKEKMERDFISYKLIESNLFEERMYRINQEVDKYIKEKIIEFSIKISQNWIKENPNFKQNTSELLGLIKEIPSRKK